MFTVNPVLIFVMSSIRILIRMFAFLAIVMTTLMSIAQVAYAQSGLVSAIASHAASGPSFSSSAQTFSEKEDTNRVNTYFGQIYANTDVFVCGKKKIVITSTCVAADFENTDPVCFSQSVSFVQIADRQAVSFFYSYEQDEQKFIRSAACLRNKNEFFVVLENANLANCKICEWSDYFSVNGFYIGSSDGLKNKTSFKKVKLTKHLEKIVLEASRIEEIGLFTIAR